MSTANKLTYLNQTKGKIKESINLTGANLTNETFRQYATTLKDTLAHILKNPSPIWDNFPKTSGTGSTIQVNTYNSLLDYSLDGNTTQSGTPTPTSPIPISNVSGLQEVDVVGKNLASDTTLKNGLWTSATNVANNGSGWYVIEKCEPNTTYTISKKNTTGTIFANFTTLYPANGVATLGQNQGSSNRKSLTITTPSNANYMFIGLFAGSPSDTQKQECIEELMLEKSETQSQYEPYIGNTYEINLGDIELNKIGNYKDYIFKGKGVNLFDKDNAPTTSDIYIDGTGKIVAGSYNKLTWIKLEPNKTYHIKQSVTPNVTMRLALFDEQPIINSQGTLLSTISGLTPIDYTFTTTEKTYLSWVYYHSNNNGGHTQQQCIDSIMVNKGATALPYEPYNAKDKWLLHKEIGKVVLDSTYRQSGGTTGTNAYYIGTTILGLNDNTQALSWSNMFQPCSFNNRVNGLDITYLQNGYLQIRTANNTSLDWSDNTKRDNWLNANKPIVYYVLATPTTTEITNSELLEDLESIELLDGINNITINGDLSAIMDLIALAKE